MGCTSETAFPVGRDFAVLPALQRVCRAGSGLLLPEESGLILDLDRIWQQDQSGAFLYLRERVSLKGTTIIFKLPEMALAMIIRSPSKFTGVSSASHAYNFQIFNISSSFLETLTGF